MNHTTSCSITGILNELLKSKKSYSITPDIPVLANHFPDLYSNKYGKTDLSFSRSAIEELEGYPWTENIRELRHNTEKAVILSETKTKFEIWRVETCQRPGNFDFRFSLLRFFRISDFAVSIFY